jgi:hypothetical protein
MAFPPAKSQRRPATVQPFSLNLSDLVLADVEALSYELARFSNFHFMVLRIHECKKNLLASVFRNLVGY